VYASPEMTTCHFYTEDELLNTTVSSLIAIEISFLVKAEMASEARYFVNQMFLVTLCLGYENSSYQLHHL